MPLDAELSIAVNRWLREPELPKRWVDAQVERLRRNGIEDKRILLKRRTDHMNDREVFTVCVVSADQE